METFEITFTIKAPHTDYESDMNTLLLRIAKLKRFYNDVYSEKAKTNIDIESHNKNIECIKEILQHMKFKTIDVR